jgi:hypothetical protein
MLLSVQVVKNVMKKLEVWREMRLEVIKRNERIVEGMVTPPLI